MKHPRHSPRSQDPWLRRRYSRLIWSASVFGRYGGRYEKDATCLWKTRAPRRHRKTSRMGSVSVKPINKKMRRSSGAPRCDLLVRLGAELAAQWALAVCVASARRAQAVCRRRGYRDVGRARADESSREVRVKSARGIRTLLFTLPVGGKRSCVK